MSFRRSGRILGAGLVAFGLIMVGAQPAWAHANLVSTDPEYGATLNVAPGQVVIRYDLPVEVNGAQVKLERSGPAVRTGRPGYASADHKDVGVPLPKLEPGKYLLTWFLFGSDGDVMGGELPFTIGGAERATGVSPGPLPGRSPKKRSFAPLSQAQDAARLISVASLSILIGGVTFVALLWQPGISLRRTRLLLGSGLAGALVGNAAALGLKGAAVSGQSALSLFSPTALTALSGTHVGRVLTARLAFLLLAVAFLTYLFIVPRRALHSDHWVLGSVTCALGALATHGMLSHASRRGPLASAIDVVHLAAVAVWLGGLVMLAAVMLPRRRLAELSVVVPRWSRLAFGAVTTAVLAGVVLLLVISPRWTALLRSPYGRFLVIKLTLVALLLAAAGRAREFVARRLPGLTVAVDGNGAAQMETMVIHSRPALPVAAAAGGAPGAAPPQGIPGLTHAEPHGPSAASPASQATRHPPTAGLLDAAPLQPFVTAVTAEICIAASILTATAVLVGRPPPT